MRFSQAASMAVTVGLATTAMSRPVMAYSADTHIAVVSMAWETMRAAADPNLVGHIAWKGTSPPPLSDPLTCALCGGPPANMEWSTMLRAMQPALAKLNTLSPELPPTCAGLPSSDGTLGGVRIGMSGDTSLNTSDATGPISCTKILGSRAQGGAYDGLWHPGGIYDATAPNPAVDGNGYQGLALGWHSKSGDDDLDDTIFTGGLVTAIVAVALIALAVVALGIISLSTLGIGAVVLLAILLIACIFGWLSGDGCGGSVAKVGTAILQDTGLESVVSEVGGWFRSGKLRDSDYTGMWHFINARGSGNDFYDDRRGLFYDEAGPDGTPGELDVMIQTLLEMGGAHLNYDSSKGPKQYEVDTSDDGHPNSRFRDRDDWQAPDGAHLEFSPLDNFGYFGWRQFRGTRLAHFLRWPLHALGDATVPMHVSGTSAWGHRPYEDTLTFGQSWSEIRFLPPKTAPELLGRPSRTCFPVASPAQNCPELVGYGDQVEQTRRILQHTLRWRRFIAAWRTRTGRMTDTPTREMITQLALETRAVFDGNTTDNRWPFCDDCSYDYKFNEAHNDKGRAYYKDPTRLALMRDLVERSIGATVAFLVASADSVPPAPMCATTTCNESTPCCHGSCQQGRCCGGASVLCGVDSDCCGPDLTCRNGQCGAPSAPQQSGAICETSGGGCATGQCTTTVDHINVCCGPLSAACVGDSGCCSGHCGDSGTCTLFPLGTTCTSASQCETNGCASGGVPVPPGGTGLCCSVGDGGDCHPENGNADCCDGTCLQVGTDAFQCQKAVQCRTPGAFCTVNAQCCSGGCGHESFQCLCSGQGSTCVTDVDCCFGATCALGVCGPSGDPPPR